MQRLLPWLVLLLAGCAATGAGTRQMDVPIDAQIVETVNFNTLVYAAASTDSTVVETVPGRGVRMAAFDCTTAFCAVALRGVGPTGYVRRTEVRSVPRAREDLTAFFPGSTWPPPQGANW